MIWPATSSPPSWVLAVESICRAILAQLNRATAPPSQCMRITEARRNGYTGWVGQSLVVEGKVQGLRFEW